MSASTNAPWNGRAAQLRNHKKRSGFAIIVAISLMSFIVMLLLSLALIVQVETLTAERTKKQAIAREHARFGALMAIGELQKFAGKDQRVTAAASVMEDPTASKSNTLDLSNSNKVQNRNLVGVWDSDITSGTQGDLLEWLISSPSHTDEGSLVLTKDAADMPENFLSGNYLTNVGDLNPATPDTVALLVGNGSVSYDANSDGTYSSTETNLDDFIVAPLVHVKATDSRPIGRYAWWVGDSGVKAKVNAINSVDYASNAGTTEFRQESFYNTDISNLAAIDYGAASNYFSSLVPSDLPKATTLRQASLANNNNNEPMRLLFHDLSLDTMGLIVDVKNGGFRKDLNRAFEENSVYSAHFGTYNPTNGVASRAANMYFIPNSAIDYSNPNDVLGQPNFDILRSYYSLHTLASSGTMPMQAPTGVADSNAGSWGWAVYPPTGADIWQGNHPVFPITARLQASLGVTLGSAATKSDGVTSGRALRLLIKPMVAFYNPNNVTITGNRFWCEIAFNTSVEIRNNTTGDYVEFRVNEILPAYTWGARFRFLVPNNINAPFSLGPGETRMFGLAGTDDIGTWPNSNKITNLTDSTAGIFYQDLNASNIIGATSAGKTGRMEVGQDNKQGLTTTEKDRMIVNATDSITVTFRYDVWESGGYTDIKYINNPAEFWNGVTQQSLKDVFTSTYQVSPYPSVSQTSTAGSLPANPWAAQILHLRTTNDEDTELRNLVESNPRPINVHGRGDGFNISFAESFGENYSQAPTYATPNAALASYTGSRRYSAASSYVGKLSNDINEVFPQTYPSTNISYSGNSLGAGGQTHVPLFDVPREPLTSIAQLQHAQLTRWSNHPAYVVGNSYANSRIPRNATYVQNFANIGSSSASIVDIPYYVNDVIWDKYYFSSLPQNTSDLNSKLSALENKTGFLPLHRLRFYRPEAAQGDSYATISNRLLSTNINETSSAWEGFDSATGHLMIDGAFNINSTSVEAWKTFLGSLSDSSDIPYWDFSAGQTAWSPNPTGYDSTPASEIYVSRFYNPIDSRGLGHQFPTDPDALYFGYRTITASQLDSLAQRMVEEVKKRGPFLSLGDFVNRKIEASELGDMGALQAALDNASGNINSGSDFTGFYANPAAASPNGKNLDTTAAFVAPGAADAVMEGEQMTSYPGWVNQADILQHLGPYITARSDTFTIRSYGNSYNELQGQVESESWCEIQVQRIPDPVVDATDPREFAEPTASDFGRKYKIISFRWLNKDDV